MSYERLKVKDHVDKWDAEKLAHVEDGIIANEAEIVRIFDDLKNYALKEDLPQDLLNMIALTQEEILVICQ
jgi:nitrogen fixation/metabolism regulation signal transduction histidine kinase